MLKSTYLLVVCFLFCLNYSWSLDRFFFPPSYWLCLDSRINWRIIRSNLTIFLECMESSMEFRARVIWETYLRSLFFRYLIFNWNKNIVFKTLFRVKWNRYTFFFLKTNVLSPLILAHCHSPVHNPIFSIIPHNLLTGLQIHFLFWNVILEEIGKEQLTSTN